MKSVKRRTREIALFRSGEKKRNVKERRKLVFPLSMAAAMYPFLGTRIPSFSLLLLRRRGCLLKKRRRPIIIFTQRRVHVRGSKELACLVGPPTVPQIPIITGRRVRCLQKRRAAAILPVRHAKCSATVSIAVRQGRHLFASIHRVWLHTPDFFQFSFPIISINVNNQLFGYLRSTDNSRGAGDWNNFLFIGIVARWIRLNFNKIGN